MSQYSGNNSDGQFDPSYRVDGEKTPINVEPVAIEVNGEQILGYQSTYANGTSKWTAEVHTDDIFDNDRFDNSTFTGKKVDGRWIWEPTTQNSIKNLANDWIGNGVDYEKVNTDDIARSFFGNQNLKKNFNNTRIEALKAEEGGSLAKVKEKFPGMPGTNRATESRSANEDGSLSLNLTNAIPDAEGTRKKYGKYHYPQDLETNKQDRIIFTMFNSGGKVINSSLDANTNNFQRESTKIQGSVILPIQSGIKDENSVNWGKDTLNPLQAFGAAAAINMVDAAGTEGKTVMGEGKKALRKAGAAVKDPGVGDAINVYLAGQAVGSQRLLSRAAGAIANPNLELLFDAPNLRAFAYTFQMSPRDHKEAAQIKSIINFFKQGMSVKTSTTNIFLKSPNVFGIEYVSYNSNGTLMKHPSINRIKKCALLVCSVDYTPNNSYMTYSDATRSMVSYTMSLQFNELDPIYEKDYSDTLNMKDSEDPSYYIGY